MNKENSIFSEELLELARGKKKNNIKLKYDYDGIIEMKQFENNYSCGGGEYCECGGEYTYCLHPSYIAAEKCMKTRVDYLNSICPNCKDGRMIKYCDSVYHRLPKVKFNPGEWRVKKDE